MKKSTISGVLFAAVMLLPSLAFAEDNKPEGDSHAKSEPPMVLVSIERKGNARLTGTISAIASSSISMDSWGGEWIINTSNAKLVRRFDEVASMSEFKVGDSIAVTGTASMKGWYVTAKRVQDYSIETKNVNPRGVISNLSGSSFTITTSDNKVYQVTTDANTRFVINDKSGSFGDLISGAPARAFGVLNRNTSVIMATRVEQSTKAEARGIISSVSASVFVMSAKNGLVTVSVSTSTDMRVNGVRATSTSSLLPSMTAEVSGIWSAANTAITASWVHAHSVATSSKRKGEENER